MILAVSGHNLPLHYRQRRPESPPKVLILLDPGLRTSGGTVEDELKMKYKYTLTGDDTLTFRYTRKGKTTLLKMSRQEPSGCAARIAPAMPE